ncbi:MAG: hypothetical protein J2P17_21455 [Mycobacterium sp.]|nr:hypothetical protein [Mycobacterium sp.]
MFTTDTVQRLSPVTTRRLQAPSVARCGTEITARHRTGPDDCVHSAGSGAQWADKPPVIASYAVIRWCEELCMIALLDAMPEGYCSLGVEQRLSHLGPIAVGSEIVITARCVRARGRFSRWEVVVRDCHELVGQGHMDFVAVYRTRYEQRRLSPKYRALQQNATSECLSGMEIVNRAQ